MSQFELRVQWLDPPPPGDAFGPERATWATLELWLGGELLTRNRSADASGELAGEQTFVTGAMSGLAEWIVDHWLPLQWETHTPLPKLAPLSEPALPSLRDALAGWPEFLGEDDALTGDELGQWQQRHTFGEGCSDLALPSLVLVPAGAEMAIGIDHLPPQLSPSVRFVPSEELAWPALVAVPAADVAEALVRFVETTMERARRNMESALWADKLAERWRQRRTEASAPAVQHRIRFGDVVAEAWAAIEQRLGPYAAQFAELLEECAIVRERSVLDALLDELTAPPPVPSAEAATLMPALAADWSMPMQREGWRIAQALRAALQLGDDPVGQLDVVLERCGLTAHAVPAHGLFRTAVWLQDGKGVLLWADDDPLISGGKARRFAIAAALGRRLAEGPTVTSLAAAHGPQARWRGAQLAHAFAAEFLLPVQAIHRHGRKPQKLGKRYGLSRAAAKWHIESRMAAALTA